MEFLFFIVAGFFVAIVSSIIGIGGGIVFVPVFLYMFPHWEPMHVVGTSLFIVMVTSISGSIGYMRQGKVLKRAALIFSLSAVPGSIFGAYMSNFYSGPWFRFIFGAFLFCVAIIVFMRNRKQTEAQLTAISDAKDVRYSLPLGMIISVCVGFISAIFGIGGGLIQVPAFIYLMGFPTYFATATSQGIIAISSTFGVITHAIEHHIMFREAIACSIGALLGAQVGVYLSKSIRAKSILYILCVMIGVLSLRMIVTSHVAW